LFLLSLFRFLSAFRFFSAFRFLEFGPAAST